MILIFLGAGLTVLAALGLGSLLLRAIGVRLYRVEQRLFAYLAGSAALSTIVFLLCAVHLARESVFITIGLLATVAALRQRPKTPAGPSLETRWLLLFLIPFLTYSVLYFVYALAPEASPDGASYHLGSVLRWSDDHGFVRYTGSIYADLSQGLELLFLFAFSLGRHSAATLIHFSYLLLLPWLIVSYGLRFGLVKPCLLGALLVFMSPVLGITGTSAYNDLAAACLVFALFYVLQIWDESRNHRLLALAGILAGFGYAVKYTAGIGIVYAAGFVIWRLTKSRQNILRPLVILLSCAAILILPWMLKNVLWIGNPVAPFLNTWFPNPYIHTSFDKEYAARNALYEGVKSRAELPYLWSIGGDYIGGLFGPWLLLTPLALFSANTKEGRRFLAAAIVFGLPALANNSARMLFPFAVFIAPALAIVASRIPVAIPAVIVLHAILSWPRVVPRYALPQAWRLARFPLAAAFRMQPEEEYLRSKLPGYDMARAIDRLLPKQAHVFMLASIPQAYTTRHLWNFYESAQGELAFQWIRIACTPDVQPTWQFGFSIPDLPAHAIRIVQTGPKRNDMWKVSEMRIFHRGVEIPRARDWRVAAFPNSWDAVRAFDNNEVSFWSPWQDIGPGQYLEERFDSPVAADRVVLESPTGPWNLTLAVQGLDANGRWTTLPQQFRAEIRQPGPGLRRLAMKAVKSLGFDYIAARDDDPPGKDLRRYASYWGIELIYQTNGQTNGPMGAGSLYRIQ